MVLEFLAGVVIAVIPILSYVFYKRHKIVEVLDDLNALYTTAHDGLSPDEYNEFLDQFYELIIDIHDLLPTKLPGEDEWQKKTK